MTTWLAIDANYLAYRALYSVGFLEHAGNPTGTIYGFLRDVSTMQIEHDTDRVAFCFDSRHSLRKVAYEHYKSNRRNRVEMLDPEEANVLESFHLQVTALRKSILPAVGYKNIFCQRGYEADDLLAMVCQCTKDKVIIVSADTDLYQCLSSRVSIWHPQRKELITRKSFMGIWGIEPFRWNEVKAICGCKTDNVPGVVGVGEKTAVKWIAGQLDPKSVKFDAICKGMDILLRNKALVTIPYAGTKEVELCRDRVDPSRWKRVTSSLGMRTLLGKVPGKKRKTRKLGGKRHG